MKVDNAQSENDHDNIQLAKKIILKLINNALI